MRLTSLFKSFKSVLNGVKTPAFSRTLSTNISQSVKVKEATPLIKNFVCTMRKERSPSEVILSKIDGVSTLTPTLRDAVMQAIPENADHANYFSTIISKLISSRCDSAANFRSLLTNVNSIAEIYNKFNSVPLTPANVKMILTTPHTKIDPNMLTKTIEEPKKVSSSCFNQYSGIDEELKNIANGMR